MTWTLGPPQMSVEEVGREDGQQSERGKGLELDGKSSFLTFLFRISSGPESIEEESVERPCESGTES